MKASKFDLGGEVGSCLLNRRLLVLIVCSMQMYVACILFKVM